MKNNVIFACALFVIAIPGCSLFENHKSSEEARINISNCEKEVESLKVEIDSLKMANVELIDQNSMLAEESASKESAASDKNKAGFWDWAFMINSFVSFAAGIAFMKWIRPAKKV